MSEQQPELRWAPIPPKPSNRGRIWLIVGLSVLALVIVGALLFFLLPRGGAPDPGSSASPSPSASPTASSTPTPSATPEDPETPVNTPPPPVDPDLATFRTQVTPRLDDAGTGLGFIADAGSQEEAASIVEQLQIDAQQLSDVVPPSSIASQWRDAVSAYSAQLEKLRIAGTGSGSTAAIESAQNALSELRAVIGS
ncbi:hypothetical protein [Microbacterium oxydans]|uniref:Uncharacterized protein n=1 Tax=Microbacterium oxydans TaxID=82380 RepID=A0A0F0L7X2_9MICO|nr:hypothetical protein [Microbacterium oxydans]KJL28400.1 hypothetical protein RS83_03471 [Microbacterium oxydans]